MSPVSPAAPIWDDSLVVTFAFQCNLACSFCMVEDVLADPYPGMSLDRFRELASDAGDTGDTGDAGDAGDALRGVRRVVLSGGEVTTSRDLPEYVAIARAIPGVDHVRVQTNAIRLADPDYARSLVDAGVDELFVSLHGNDAASCDAITGRAGSFEKIVAGMKNAVAAGATLLTNTVMVRENHERLRDIVDLAIDCGASTVELWGYWPRVHERAEVFLVSVDDVRPHLVDAMARAIARDVPPVVRWFPRCILPSELQPYHDDGQPRMLIEEQFWNREPKYACVYGSVCDEFGTKRCSGLSTAYVDRFGWEDERLRPVRKVASAEDGARRADPMLRSLLCDEGPRRTRSALAARWLSVRGMPFGTDVAGWTLATLERGRFGDRARLSFCRGEARVELLIVSAGDKLRVSNGSRGAPLPTALRERVQALLDDGPDVSLP